MKSKINIFIDSDVIISALLSNAGASSQLFAVNNLSAWISNYSVEELKVVCSRLNISEFKLFELIKQIEQVKLKKSIKKIQQIYQAYILDTNDAHIVAGAVASKAKFLITYNLKDYLREKIKIDFNIIAIKPGFFLQYLRSLK